MSASSMPATNCLAGAIECAKRGFRVFPVHSVRGGVCTCQDCVLDMAAFALNYVKPAYQVSLMGRVYAQSGTNAQHAQEIARAVRTAIARIKSNPSHD